MPAQSDSALEAFDGLRVREVSNWSNTAATFLAKFRTTAASLGPEERIKLEVHTFSDMKPLEAVLADPQANKICALRWEYSGEEDVNFIIPLLASSCPELASLEVQFEHRSAFDFASSVLEHPSNKIKVLEIPQYTKGDLPRFFAALVQSQVSALTFGNDETPKLELGLYEHLAKDLLVRFEVSTAGGEVPSELMMSLAACTRLAKLKMWHCAFSEPTALSHLPKSITKLELRCCTFVDGFDWSFLAGSNVRELDFYELEKVDGDQLGSTLAVHLRAKGLDKLGLCDCDFVDETLAAVGVEIGRVKRLDLEDSDLNNDSVELIALTLLSPNNALQELELVYDSDMADSIENHLAPALRHPNCNLNKLSFSADDPEYEDAAFTLERTFCKRRALFVLLQGQQVRRLYCPLRRLPVEMFRMVGMVLL